MQTALLPAALAALSLCSAVGTMPVAAAETPDGRALLAHPAPRAAKPDPIVPALLPAFAAPASDQDPDRAKDQLIADDLIVQGGICAGIDCVADEDFDFVTVLLKENSVRLRFDDTSSAGFPNNDWQLVANDPASGGNSRFSIEDVTAGQTPFTIRAGAPTDSLFIDAIGRLGFRTGEPALDLHMRTGDTPAIRFEQTGGAFTPQTWDIGANEANFFVRDVTAGSRLSFRIRPGAPTSSLDIAANGNVGVGTASPQARLHVSATVGASDAVPLLIVANRDYVDLPNRFEVDSNGNVAARGTISQLSSRSAKWRFAAIDGDELLHRLRSLPVSTWSYLSSEARHAGPVAEDFHAMFGLGDSDRMVAPADLAGVALAAVKALQVEVDERDLRIEALEKRLLELESRLPR